MHNIFVDWAVDQRNRCPLFRPLEVYRKILNALERFEPAQLHQTDESNRKVFYLLSKREKKWN